MPKNEETNSKIVIDKTVSEIAQKILDSYQSSSRRVVSDKEKKKIIDSGKQRTGFGFL